MKMAKMTVVSLSKRYMILECRHVSCSTDTLTNNLHKHFGLLKALSLPNEVLH